MLKMSPAKFFVFCALIFGIILITIIPPFQSPDEDSHFKRAYVISKGHLYPESRDGVVGYEIPNEMSAYINEKLSYIGNRDKKYSYSYAVLDDRLPQKYSDVTFQNFSTAETNPVAYIAPAAGIIFGKVTTRIIGMSSISAAVMLQFARVFSLLLYIILVYFAIKNTPILKKTFCILGLLPMSLALAVAISYDSVIIALCLLSTSLIFKLIFDENMKKVPIKYLVFFGFTLFVLLTIKMVYVTILVPVLFIPKEKWGEKKICVFKYLAIIAGIAFVLYMINKIPSMGLQRNAIKSNSGDQIQYILHNPLEYFGTLIRTIWQNRNFYITGMIGTFGLIDTFIPSVYIVLYGLCATAIMISDFSLANVKFNWKYKSIALCASLATIGAVFTGMYVLWTSIELGVGVDTITGVQGRYFIPIIPLVMVLFSNQFLRKNKKIETFMKNVLVNSYFVPVMMLGISVITIFLRYWC